jgi:hypothetical protein
MRKAVVQDQRPGRGWTNLVALLVIGGVALAALSDAVFGAAKAPANKETPRDEPPKLPEFKHTIDPKTPDFTDVTDAVKTINQKLEADWIKNKIAPTSYVNDFEFIRRASLDIIGRIARPEEIKEYFNDQADIRRSRLVNRLLSSEEYPRHWANLWANWLLTRSGPFGRGKYKEELTVWLEDILSNPKKYSYADMVRLLLTAEGENTKNGASNFILAHVGEAVPQARRGEEGQFEMVPVTSRLTRVFLGIQVQCAQCHDHPFHSSIKQRHFWGINAYLRQVVRQGNPPMMDNRDTPGPLTLKENTNVCKDGEVFYEQRNGVILTQKAEFLPSGDAKHGKRLDPEKTGVARREALAEALIEHEQFPRATVNRIWGVFFGRGFVNPVDDFNDNNKPTNPELLDELAVRFKNYNYDVKKLIRWICNSNAYHLSCVANKSNDKQEHETLFSRMTLKAMSPEQLFESLMVASRAEAAESKDGKKQARDRWLGNLISNFGDDEGNEVNFNGTVVQALMMMNGEDINNAIARKDKGTVALAMRGGNNQKVITDLYMAALNRPPSAREMSSILSQFPLRAKFQKDDYQNPARRYEDLFWALLNSNEFMLNH